jgi:DNA-binding transcriptional regulator LsrR (DeoR family)
MKGNELSNPIISSWITAFIRSVVSEMLHNIYLLGGQLISVTTDGFLTDVKDLENRLIEKFGLSKIKLN